MAKRVVDDVSLTAVADAIREYPEFTEPINFPNGFVNDVQNLVSLIRGLVDGSTSTEVFIPMGATKIRDSAFRSVTTMTAIHVPEGVESVGTQAFWDCYMLTELKLPSSCVSIGEMAFSFASRLRKIDTYATSIKSKAFWATYGQVALILRNTSEVCSLSNLDAFNENPISSGGGYIYVPRSLVDSYKAATNWSTYASQIRAIEDYPEITGG